MHGRVLFVAGTVNGRRRYRSPLRAEQATATRRRTLVAARELFLANGYGGTTVAAIAEAAGVSADTIYVSLGGKRGRHLGNRAQHHLLRLSHGEPTDGIAVEADSGKSTRAFETQLRIIATLHDAEQGAAPWRAFEGAFAALGPGERKPHGAFELAT